MAGVPPLDSAGSPAEPTNDDTAGDLEDQETLGTVEFEIDETPGGDSVGRSDEDRDPDEAPPDSYLTVQEAIGATVELPADAEPSPADIELIYDDDADEKKPPTIAIAEGATIEFGDSPADESYGLVTSQWQSNVEGDSHDPQCTIRQKDTLSQTHASQSSSLVVKSRQVRSVDESSVPVVSPTDAPDYELIDVIGEGGMGVVYAARQASIARTVAVKMLKEGDVGTSEQRDKFISEAVITGELDHPNIVPIYDLGANDRGALFYSMKRVKGTPWDDVIKTKSLDENLNILLRVADAVAFAHVNGVIHRDLKPENVMLGDFGEVLVMDWGLARISPEFPNAESVSQSNAMGGTPAYMAPEMAIGPIDAITTSSDVYLLGAILYEVVTGRPPHSGKSVMACLFAAAKNQIAKTETSGELLDIALKAMATDQQQRHGGVLEFQDAVRRYQAHSESILLTEHAAKNLTSADNSQDYDLYARSVYGFEEALSLWNENQRAAQLLQRARLAYAGAALDKGDFDLGVSLLDEQDAAHRPVLERLQAGINDRDSRQRRLKLFKGLVAGLAAAVIAIGSIAYVAVSKQRDRAVEAEAEALANFREAEAAREEEEMQKNRAVKAEAEALENYDKAEAARKEELKQKGIAQEAEAEARENARLAVEAKQSEEYAGYVARIGLTMAKIEENAFDRAAELLEQCPVELRHWEWGRLNQLCRLSEATWQAYSPVDSAVFAPDGLHFATGDWDGTASIWNRRTGEREWSAKHGRYVHSVAYDAAGERLA
ncbi:MAG: serine/threonine-protein kinase, partial [Planctomycetota bacterium]